MPEPLTTRSTSTAAPPKMQHRDLTAREFTVRADSANIEARTVEAVIATENRATVFDFNTFRLIDEILIMRGAKLQDVSLLESHHRWSTDSVHGSALNMRVEGAKAIGTLEFAEDDDSDKRFRKVVKGHIRAVSAGYQVKEYEDIPAGETRTVAGKRYTAGERTLRISLRWVLREVSLVAIGADPDAIIREEAGNSNARGGTRGMNKHLLRALHKIGLNKQANEDEAQRFYQGLDAARRAEVDQEAQRAEAAVNKPADNPPAADPPNGQRRAPAGGDDADDDDVPPSGRRNAANPPADVPVDQQIQAALRADRERQTAIRGLAGDDIPEEMVERAINEGWTAERAGHAFLQHQRDSRTEPVGNGGQFAAQSRSHEKDCTRDALTCALIARSGFDPTKVVQRHSLSEGFIRPLKSDADKQRFEQAANMGERYEDMSLLDMCREAIRLDGRGGSMPHGRYEIIQRALSGGAVQDIFNTNVATMLIVGFEESQDSTAPWTRDVDVANFQTQDRTRLGKMANLSRLARGDEAEHASRSAVNESYSIARYAKQYVLDDQDIIDDRLDAFSDSPLELGRAAFRLRPDLVWSIMLANAALNQDSTALFHADHSNLQTSSAFAKATLETAITDLNTQTEDGVTLNQFGKYLLVPSALVFDARTVVRSGNLIIAGTADPPTVQGDLNPIAEEDITIISDARMDNGVTDPRDGSSHAGSASTWFMASKSSRHTIEIGHLRGTGRRPMLRSKTLDGGRWGIQWDIKMDIGGAPIGFRGLHKNTA